MISPTGSETATERDKTFVLSLGAQKCGTTWLYRYLSSYKFADFGAWKEYHVWDAVSVPACRGFRTTFRESLFDARMRLRRRLQSSPRSYFQYFSDILNSGNISMTGDFTPSYSALSGQVLSEIHAGTTRRGMSFKAVLLMRDPVERCWSSVRMRRRLNAANGKTHATSESDDLLLYARSEEARIRTRYDDTLRSAGSAFPQACLHVGLFEDLFSDSSISELSDFFHVEPKFEFRDRTFNVSDKTGQIPDDIRRQVARQFEDVYAYCASRFPRVADLWSGMKLL